jgi:hypothetical protein
LSPLPLGEGLEDLKRMEHGNEQAR